MPSSSSTPKLPLWIFFATDVILVGAAVWIARQSQHPLPEMTALAIAGCVIAGAVAGLVPLVVYYERQKNETLDDRQRALEALARTVSSSAEQISIAAGGLHEIAEIAQKNLKHAEQLPHKLQEKVAEFQAQLANANDAEREELERELEELRAGETERLQSTSDKIARTVAELVKLESATQGHVTAANDALAKLSFSAAGAIGKAQVAAEQAFNQARLEASRGVGEASGKAVTAIEAAKTTAIEDLSRHFGQHLSHLRDASTGLAALVERIERAAAHGAGSPGTPLPGSAQPAATPVPWSAPLEPAAMTATAPTVPDSASSLPSASAETPGTIETSAPAVVSLALPAASQAPITDPTFQAGTVESTGERQRDDSAPTAAAPAPKRSRKKAEPKPEVPAPPSNTPPDQAAPPALESAADQNATTEPVNAGGPPAVQGEPETPPQGAAVVEVTEPDPAAEPIAQEVTTSDAPELAEATDPGHTKTGSNGDEDAPAVEASRPRGRNRRSQDDQPGLGLDLGEFEGRPAPTVESVLSSDGATRLIVTAYIGIGNRLFIRGDGPGLSWDKGVPLQFVSIGKWRWETNDATGPVKFKLLKNDEHESAGLGTLSLQPAHQNEVTATF